MGPAAPSSWKSSVKVSGRKPRVTVALAAEVCSGVLAAALWTIRSRACRTTAPISRGSPRILINAGVPVNHVNNLGWTALQEAVLLNSGGPRQQDVVSQLLAAGADPGIRDPQGRTALENAERLGFTQLAEIIRAEIRPAQ